MKKEYEIPVVDLVRINSDVICTSGGGCVNGTDFVPCGFDNGGN